MPLDSSSSHSIADETKCFQIIENNEFSKGKFCAEPDCETGPVVEFCAETKGGREKITVEKRNDEASFTGYRKKFYYLSKEFLPAIEGFYTSR